MISDILFTTFKILLGKSRAFHLNETNISNISKSFLTPFEELVRIFYRIAFAPFPSQNTYSTETEQKQDIINFENQFGISTSRATISERANNIEAQFGLVGNQGFGYLQKAIINAGIDARVVENIPVQDLINTNLVQYGLHQYGFKQYGQSGYTIVGNGLLQIGTTNKDPAVLNDNKQCFLIEKSTGGVLQITGGQYDILVDLILRIKPLEKVALLNISLV